MKNSIKLITSEYKSHVKYDEDNKIMEDKREYQGLMMKMTMITIIINN